MGSGLESGRYLSTKGRAVTDRLAQLYPQHVATVMARATHALERGRCDHLIVPSGAASRTVAELADSGTATSQAAEATAHGMAIKPPRRKLKTRACTFIMPAPVRDAFAGCSTLPDPSISQPWPASPFAPDSAPMMPLFQWAGRRARRQAIPATASPRPLL